VVARGNHELCSRAGPGYFYLLDPHSSLLGGELSCPVQESGGDPVPNLVFVPSYRLDLGTLGFVVLDSANACDAFPNFVDTYTQQFEAVATLAAGGKPLGLVGHRPLWGVDAAASPGAFEIVNAALQKGLRRSAGGSLPAAVELVLSGHMHRFEALSFQADRPPQLVVGNSGTELSGNALTGLFATEVDGEAARGLAANAFGYLDGRLLPNGHWLGQVVDPRTPGSEVLASCGSLVLKATGRVCVPAPDLRRGLGRERGRDVAPASHAAGG
jgi:hypothetical protein